ncbi:MAG: hypothetical protein OXC72_05675, partial [Roseovarius sp.]|nr:hypothetical protein [Roseovarius sp.]
MRAIGTLFQLEKRVVPPNPYEFMVWKRLADFSQTPLSVIQLFAAVFSVKIFGFSQYSTSAL